jgi:hypothetical protein
MKREFFKDCSTVNLASRVSSVKYSDSIPEETVAVRFEVGRGANFKMSSGKNLLEGREVLKRASLRLYIFPQPINRIQEVRGVHNRGGEAGGRIPVCEIGCKGYTHWDVIRDVGASFVLVRESVDVLIGGKRGYRVMVPVPVGGEGVG